ncbi:MAG: phosphoribosylanthranilate isomerase [Myxococcota bacterium]|nr:phosphoribosylanthranilate isomerase [Myxococcota bacterium]
MWVKVCGLRTRECVDAAIEAGVDAIGFVLAPSVRQVAVHEARALAVHIAGRVSTVGVVRRLDRAALEQCRAAELDIAQGVPVGVSLLDGVLPVLQDDDDLLRAAAALPGSRLLVDGANPGSGVPADWSRVAELAKHRSIVLAGGLNACNVSAAIKIVRPVGVDVSSGIEQVPGRKDPEMIFAFTRAARRAAASLELH